MTNDSIGNSIGHTIGRPIGHPVELRRCHGIEEFRACVALQKEVWNFTDAELVPLRMFVVADKVGGQVRTRGFTDYGSCLTFTFVFLFASVSLW